MKLAGKLLGLLALWIAAPAAAQMPACSGNIDLTPIGDKRFVFFGELPGTIQSPAFIARVVCSVAARRPVVLGLDLWASEQGALDEYMRSAGSAVDRAALLANRAWNRSEHDGVASVATFDLVDAARRLRAAGGKIEVVALSTSPQRVEGDSFERYTARREREASTLLTDRLRLQPDSVAIVLIGYSRALHDTDQRKFESLPKYLPRPDAISLMMAHDGGHAWLIGAPQTAKELPAGTAVVSAARYIAPRPCSVPGRAATIELGPTPFPGFDGCYLVGPITAAPIARGNRD